MRQFRNLWLSYLARARGFKTAGLATEKFFFVFFFWAGSMSPTTRGCSEAVGLAGAICAWGLGRACSPLSGALRHVEEGTVRPWFERAEPIPVDWRVKAQRPPGPSSIREKSRKPFLG